MTIYCLWKVANFGKKNYEQNIVSRTWIFITPVSTMSQSSEKQQNEQNYENWDYFVAQKNLVFQIV